jgi:hypothetical protein
MLGDKIGGVLNTTLKNMFWIILVQVFIKSLSFLGVFQWSPTLYPQIHL